jgi:thiol-disulfide isomerase/thioredoxin
MRSYAFNIVLLCLLLPLFAFGNDSLLNKRMPILPGHTLDGRTIDASYYKGHLTLVNFMYIGCQFCMNEIGILNKLKAEYANDPRFQLLCIPWQMRAQMVEFNSDNKVMFAQVRKALGLDTMQYTILPGCADAASKMETNGEHVTIKSECATLEEMFGVTSFPTNFLVDADGIIRKIDNEGPKTKNQPEFYETLKKEIDELLAQQQLTIKK